MTDNTTYADIIRELPRPSLAQTERFARFVSAAHSWYKHLPLRPKVPFIFYLDPNAGRSLVHTRTNEVAVVDITDESTRFHYTWQTTETYRRRFGYWNYHASYGTSFLFAGEGGTVSTAGTGLKILDNRGEWITVPLNIQEAGMAQLSALVHPGPNFMIWANRPAKFGLAEEGEEKPEWNELLRRLEETISEPRTPPSFLSLKDRVEADLLQRMVDYTIPPEEDHYFGWNREKDYEWPEDEWFVKARSEGVQESLLSDLVKHVEQQRMTMKLPSIAKYVVPKEVRPGKISETLLTAMAQERSTQLADMTDAMYRVVEEVYDEG